MPDLTGQFDIFRYMSSLRNNRNTHTLTLKSLLLWEEDDNNVAPIQQRQATSSGVNRVAITPPARPSPFRAVPKTYVPPKPFSSQDIPFPEVLRSTIASNNAGLQTALQGINSKTVKGQMQAHKNILGQLYNIYAEIQNNMKDNPDIQKITGGVTQGLSIAAKSIPSESR